MDKSLRVHGCDLGAGQQSSPGDELKLAEPASHVVKRDNSAEGPNQEMAEPKIKGRSWLDHLLLGVVAASLLAGGIAITMLVVMLTDGEDSDVEVVSQIPTSTVRPTRTSEEIEATATSAAAASAEAGARRRETAIARPPITPRPSPYKLALVSASCTYRSNFVTCEGFVKNISSLALENVEVVINWYDTNDIPRSSQDALIEYDPILAGQTSPWSSIGRYNPALTGFRVEFKEFFGGTILTRDDRQ